MAFHVVTTHCHSENNHTLFIEGIKVTCEGGCFIWSVDVSNVKISIAPYGGVKGPAHRTLGRGA